MATLKNPKVGVYGPKTRLLQQKLSYERTSLTWKTANIYKYLGSRVNGTPSISDVQDLVFMETPDRAYDPNPVAINCWYETLPEQPFDLSRFGILNPLGNTQQFRFHSYSFEADGLGRYITVNDVIEIPFLTQEGDKAFWEVTDVDRKTEFENYLVIVTAVPLNDKQEVAEIPNIPTNAGDLESLNTQMETEAESIFNIDGVDTSTVIVDNENSPTSPYDPRPDPSEDFLDNPNNIDF